MTPHLRARLSFYQRHRIAGRFPERLRVSLGYQMPVVSSNFGGDQLKYHLLTFKVARVEALQDLGLDSNELLEEGAWVFLD